MSDRGKVLSERQQHILSALIEEYVENASPVASRTLVERYCLGVSSATVRNDLSVLENEGCITQPHTSSGRIPTDTGYRTFVDTLLAQIDQGENRNGPFEDIFIKMRNKAIELDSLIDQTSRTLSQLTECLSIVCAPSSQNTRIKQISLISLTPYRVCIVVVNESGEVFNRSAEFREIISTDELSRVQLFLSELFIGKTLREIEIQLQTGNYRSYKDILLQTMLEEVLSCLKESDKERVHRLGMSCLLSKPEFSQSETLLPLLQEIEDGQVIQTLFSGLEQHNEAELHVGIGSENERQSLSNVSVVATKFGSQEASGMIAVIGPTRMKYSKVFSAVQAARTTLEA